MFRQNSFREQQNEQLSDKQFLVQKVHPFLKRIVYFLLKEKPSDPVKYLIKNLDDEEKQQIFMEQKIDESHQSSEKLNRSYLNVKVHPILSKITTLILIEKPQNVINFVREWLWKEGVQYSQTVKLGQISEQSIDEVFNSQSRLKKKKSEKEKQVQFSIKKVQDLEEEAEEDDEEEEQNYGNQHLEKEKDKKEKQTMDNLKKDEDQELFQEKEDSEEDEELQDGENGEEEEEEYASWVPLEMIRTKYNKQRLGISAEVFPQQEISRFKFKQNAKKHEQFHMILKKISGLFMCQILDQKSRELLVECFREVKIKANQWVFKQKFKLNKATISSLNQAKIQNHNLQDNNHGSQNMASQSIQPQKQGFQEEKTFEQECCNFYIVENGELDCFRLNKNKNEKEQYIKTLTTGECFGEEALIHEIQREYSVRTKTETILWVLDRQTLNALIIQQQMKKKIQYENFLSQIELLQEFTQDEMWKIADALQVTIAKAGSFVMKQGDDGNRFYLIEEGELVAMIVLQPGENPKEVKQYKAGMYFGEIALLKNQSRAASILCKTDCTLGSLDRQSFKRLFGPMENILSRNMEQYNKYNKML